MHPSPLAPSGATGNRTIDVLTVVGLALAVVGIAFAIWQTRESRRQAKDLTQINATAEQALDRLEPLVSGLDRVAHALPTRVLGDWPSYLTDLARFVGRTEHNLKILCDVPAYGIASNLDGYHVYQRAIEQCLVDGKDVSTIFLGPASRRRLNEEFSPDEENWSPEYRARIEGWVDRLKAQGLPVERPASRAELLDILETTNVKAVERLDSAALLGSRHMGRATLSRREADGMMPLYVWVRDGVEAVFAVAVLSDAEDEIAFVTIDPGLVAALEGVFDRYSSENGSCSVELAAPWPDVDTRTYQR